MVGGLLGLALFMVLYGAHILDPGNIGWLMAEDAATHYIGWHFFRNEEWGFPLGALHRYGMEVASSVVYSDSLPLFALLFKPFSSWLPKLFQYTGIWIALCYFLQGFWGWWLLSRLSPSWGVRLFGTAFFLLSPLVMLRGDGHFALMGHWLILAAFSLYFAPSSRFYRWGWVALIVLAALVHAYLASMVLAIWVADTVKRLVLDRGLAVKEVFQAGMLILVSLMLAMWQGGYFSSAGIAGGGAGYYSMNLLAPFSPTPGADSLFLPNHAAATGGQYEGFNYLGLGIILLLVSGLWRVRRDFYWREFKPILPLLVVCGLLGIYALSPKITLGGKTLLQVSLPSLMQQLTEIFRASGRMFWPAYYALVLGAIALAVRGRSNECAMAVLGIALGIQVADLAPVIGRRIEAATVVKHFESPLKSPFWEEAGKRYKRVVVVPPVFTVQDFIPLTFYAATHDMEVNIAYYGRLPSKEAERRREESVRSFLAGRVDPEALYVFREPRLLGVVEPSLNHDAGVGVVDGMTVVAPGWLGFASRSSRGLLPPKGERALASIRSGQAIHFGDAESRKFALAGWSWPENWGTWTDGPVALFGAHLEGGVEGDVIRARFRAVTLDTSNNAATIVNVFAYGKNIAQWRFVGGRPEKELVALIPADIVRSHGGNLLMSFVIQDPVSPTSLGMGYDPRLLGLGMVEAEFHYSVERRKF